MKYIPLCLNESEWLLGNESERQDKSPSTELYQKLRVKEKVGS